MKEPDLIARQRSALRDLAQLAQDRDDAEREIETDYRARRAAANATRDAETQRLTEAYEAEKGATQQEFDQVRQDIASHFEAETKAARNKFAAVRLETKEQHESGKKEAEAAFQEARWTIGTVFEADKTKAESDFQEFERKMASHVQRIAALRQEAEQAFAEWMPQVPETSAERGATADDADDDSLPRVRERVSAAEIYLMQGRELWLLKLARGKHYLAAVITAGLVTLVPAAWHPARWIVIPIVLVATAIMAVVGHVLLRTIARQRVQQLYPPMLQALAEGEAWCQFCREQASSNGKRIVAKSRKRHDETLRQAETGFRNRMAALEDCRDSVLQQAEQALQQRTAAANAQRDAEASAMEERYPRLLQELDDRFATDTERVREQHRQEQETNDANHTATWAAMANAWHEGLASIRAAIADIDKACEIVFPPWSDSYWRTFIPPSTFPPVIRFGEFAFDLDAIPHGIPADERLRSAEPTAWTLPALLGFPAQCSILVRSSEATRNRADVFLQLLMLRLLTALPPSKVRFTIIDPVGLGRNFAAFMHLADHDEALVASRIWTEQSHIEQRLTDLTAHMETVIQKYLRNQYATIEEYNAPAGEVAEPFRFLVVANFPVNFSPEAARRLVSIAASGARCGVHVLLSLDTKQSLPQGFHLEDLEPHTVVFEDRPEALRWRDGDFGKWPLRLDALPDADTVTRLLQAVGQEAKSASRVEVPFEFIVPSTDTWWTGDSRGGIHVPIGRSGATKRQQLSLGHGTAQHVLVAGKTGSGKSTLLHALITNLALTYSPDEVELYLVDFKEGVEFKDYATYQLPHARVVAIESEREFGVSVLQRLDSELKERGDRFRALGVQDIAGYRQIAGQPALPRVLLIVDEFQLFFVEDDKMAQDAALLLDRLVRQGRAFGIHVLLGSQTLGGAYTLARSTLGQMAVRIALQCSETDAHLILSDDNTAARILSRPGEAIYNDANGLVEGNDFFQVVWLPDHQRESYLRQIQDTAAAHGHVRAHPQIVFEGRAPADVAKNYLLQRLLTAPEWPPSTRVCQAWLGEAMAIKDPTAADFRPQGGRNLLLIGQDDEAALSLLTTSILSVAGQQAPEEGGARFYVLDGSAIDSPRAGYLAGLAEIVPHPMKLGGYRDASAFLTEIADEVDRRVKAPEAEMPAVYLVIHGLQRFRDLRRQEDDFSFSRRGDNAPPNPGKLFGTILRDGPPVAVYVLVWSDTLNNANRTLDRQGLREFDQRILFQMSAADSSALIDTPQASKLGPFRALLYREDRGHAEKFRPYGLPPQSWLEWVKEQLQRKAVPQRV